MAHSTPATNPEPGPRPAYSNPQLRLPIAEAEWDTYRLVKRGRRVRVGSATLKTFYLSLLGMSQPLKLTDIGTFTVPLHILLHDLESSERAFYAKRRKLIEQGLLVVVNRGAFASKYSIIASRTLAAAPPPISAESAEMEPPPQLPISATVAEIISEEVAEIISEEVADVRRVSSGVSVGEQQQQQAALGGLPLQPVDADPEPVHLAKPPSARQLRGIDDMGDEIRAVGLEPAGPDRPVTRSQASEVFRLRRAQVRALRDPATSRAIRRGGGR